MGNSLYRIRHYSLYTVDAYAYLGSGSYTDAIKFKIPQWFANHFQFENSVDLTKANFMKPYHQGEDFLYDHHTSLITFPLHHPATLKIYDNIEGTQSLISVKNYQKTLGVQLPRLLSCPSYRLIYWLLTNFKKPPSLYWTLGKTKVEVKPKRGMSIEDYFEDYVVWW